MEYILIVCFILHTSTATAVEHAIISQTRRKCKFSFLL